MPIRIGGQIFLGAPGAQTDTVTATDENGNTATVTITLTSVQPPAPVSPPVIT